MMARPNIIYVSWIKLSEKFSFFSSCHRRFFWYPELSLMFLFPFLIRHNGRCWPLGTLSTASFPGSSLFLLKKVPWLRRITTKVFTRSVKSCIRRMFAYKGRFEFDWITHRQFDGQPIFCDEKFFRRFCTWYQQRLRADLYFSIGKITTLTAELVHSFRVW